MSVTSPDKRYLENKDQWEKNRDAYKGQRFIHAKGSKYLPPVGNMDLNTQEGRELYRKFKDRTLFMNATGRTVDGLVGLIFRKDPVNELPAKLSYLVETVDLSRQSLKELEETVSRELAINGIVGVHTTMPETPYGISVAEAERMNIRPYLVTYRAEDITKIFYRVINNMQVMEMIVLREVIQISDGSEFTRVDKDQFRVLDLYTPNQDEIFTGGMPIYRERLFDEGGALVYEMRPLKNGQYFNYIPFELIALNTMGKSPIEDLVNTNINHYQYNASYSWGVYQAGFPTPTAVGVDKEDVPTEIGPGTLWHSENPAAKFDILESKSGSSDKGKIYLDKVESYMVALGAEMLSPAKMVAETSESKRLDKQAQSSVLSTIAQLTSKAIERALRIAAEWVGANPDEVKISLNRDYFPSQISPQMLSSLVAALQSGSISYETFWQNLQAGEVASTNKDAQDERDLIDADAGGLGS